MCALSETSPSDLSAADQSPEPDVAEDERVSAAILARVLQERERERSAGCSCGGGGLGPRLVDVACQTHPTHIGDRDATCQAFVFDTGGRRAAGPPPQHHELPQPSEPMAIRQTVVIGRPRAARQASGDLPPALPAMPAAQATASSPWWPSGEASDSAWDNNFDFSPPRSRAESRRTESVSSSESMSTTSATAGGRSSAASSSAAAAAAALRMETRI